MQLESRHGGTIMRVDGEVVEISGAVDGTGIDPAEPRLGERVHALQVLRMMEQLASGNLAPGIAGIRHRPAARGTDLS
jgi:hypothetical protein